METTTSSSSSTKVETFLLGLFVVLLVCWFAMMVNSCHNHTVQSTVNRAINAKLAEIDRRNEEASIAASESRLPTESEAN